MIPTLRRAAVTVLVLAAGLAAVPVHAQPVEQEWASPVRNPHYLGSIWGDGVPRALVDNPATNTIRVLNLQTGALEGAVPARYGLLSGMNGVQFIDPDGSGQLRLLLAGRLTVGQPWYVGAFTLTAGGTLALAWEQAQTTMLGVHTTRILGGAGEDVVTRRSSGSASDGYLALHDGIDGALLWDQQAAGVPAHVTFQDMDFSGDGLTDWLLEVRTGSSAPIETRLFLSSSVAVGTPPPAAAASLGLAPNAPNPFVGDTRIAWTQPGAGNALVRVFDPAGREVRTLARGLHDAGSHQLTWDGRDDAGRAVAPGIYFVEVRAGGESQARRMIRLP